MAGEPLTALEQRAARKGLALAASELPVTARSLTADEVRANDARIAMIGFGIYLGFVALLAVAALVGGGLPDWAVPMALVLGVPLALFARVRARRRSDYRDPDIAVTVGQSTVTVRDVARSAEIAYCELRILRIAYYSANRSLIFLGMEIETPLGPLKLEEGWLRGGTRAAATILKQLDGQRSR
jgi:hypothetical protein